MFTQEAHSMGGKIMAARQRKEALANYYNNPNQCKYCNKTISIPEGGNVYATRIKKFCNSSCAASANNISKRTACVTCNKPIRRRSTNKYYSEPHCFQCITASNWANTTKGELFATCKTWQSARGYIRKLAVKIYRSSHKNQVCLICGYSDWRVLEVAHRRAVSDFPDTALLGEINNIDNLEALCPTHHTEFDKGIRLLP